MRSIHPDNTRRTMTLPIADPMLSRRDSQNRLPALSGSAECVVGKEVRTMLRVVVPEGVYAVDAEALHEARQGVPAGEYHVDAEALRQARQGVPRGEYHV